MQILDTRTWDKTILECTFFHVFMVMFPWWCFHGDVSMVQEQRKILQLHTNGHYEIHVRKDSVVSVMCVCDFMKYLVQVFGGRGRGTCNNWNPPTQSARYISVPPVTLRHKATTNWSSSKRWTSTGLPLPPHLDSTHNWPSTSTGKSPATK